MIFDWTRVQPINALSNTDAIRASSIMAVVIKGFPFNLPFASILLILLLCLQSGEGQKKKEVRMHSRSCILQHPAMFTSSTVSVSDCMDCSFWITRRRSPVMLTCKCGFKICIKLQDNRKTFYENQTYAC